MAEWKKRGACTTFEEYVQEKTGTTSADIQASGSVTYICPQIPEIAEKIRINTRPICVVADYDADGIGSAAILHSVFKKLGLEHQIIIPKRMKEGYGMNPSMVERIKPGSLVITIDNGISANEAIDRAYEAGMEVVIMDHHLASGVLPKAEIIADPEQIPDGWTFDGYCGAGLAFKLAEELFPKETEFLDTMSCFAAISTIADSVNVTGDNRNIILRGLKNINSSPRRCLPGLSALLDVVKERDRVDVFGVTEIAFKVAPIINAPGRLDDDGGIRVLTCLFAGSDAKEKAEAIYEENRVRISLVKEAIEEMEVRGSNISFVYDEKIREGICGIIAGKLAQESHKPAFVMTKAENGLIKGSARCEEDCNVFEMISGAGYLLAGYGGHQCAAGFSLQEQNLEELLRYLDSHVSKDAMEASNYYDLEAEPSQLTNMFLAMRKIDVFGAGLEKPVIKVTSEITDAKKIGADKTHLTFKVHGGTKTIAFGMAEAYFEMGEPNEMTVYGTLEVNWWKGTPYVQLQAVDIEKEAK